VKKGVFMKYFIFLCFLVLSLHQNFTLAQSDGKSSQQTTVISSHVLQNALAASVQITSRAIDDASSAQTLGKVRQGSGVVIGSDGLILTIGYLILETEQIEIRTHQQKLILLKLWLTTKRLDLD
jgi:serine protease Do